MSKIVVISGSPTYPSRTTSLAEYAARLLAKEGVEISLISVRDLPAEDLLHANFDSKAIVQANVLVQNADAVIVITPVYKAAYTGVLKAFLDLLPQNGLANKVVLPLAVGGTIAHLLAIDYALKPVLSALGASHILGGVYLLDSQITRNPDGGIDLEVAIQARLEEALAELAQEAVWHHTKQTIRQTDDAIHANTVI